MAGAVLAGRNEMSNWWESEEWAETCEAQKAHAQAKANELGRNVEWCLGVCKPQESAK